MPGFGILEKLICGITSGMSARERQGRQLYNQYQLEILQAQDRNNDFSREYESLSMSSWQSSSASDSTFRPKGKFFSLKPVEEEFFKKEEFEI